MTESCRATDRRAGGAFETRIKACLSRPGARCKFPAVGALPARYLGSNDVTPSHTDRSGLFQGAGILGDLRPGLHRAGAQGGRVVAAGTAWTHARIFCAGSPTKATE